MEKSASTERLEIILEHPDLAVDVDRLHTVLNRVCDGEGYRLLSLSVVLTDHATVHSLNRDFLRHDYVTDVLSFDLREDETGRTVDGEIYVDLDTARERHAEFGSDFQQEVFRYAVHGLLHLTGYHDDTPARKKHMQVLEDVYLDVTDF